MQVSIDGDYKNEINRRNRLGTQGEVAAVRRNLRLSNLD